MSIVINGKIVKGVAMGGKVVARFDQTPPVVEAKATGVISKRGQLARGNKKNRHVDM